MKIKPSVNERVAKINQQRQTNESERIKQAKETINRKRNAEHFSALQREFRFNKELTALDMLMRLEGMMDRAAPKTPEEDFSPAFKLAAEMIPTVQGMIEDLQVEAMK